MGGKKREREREKNKKREKKRIDCTLGTNRVSTLVLLFFFFSFFFSFFFNVEKCVSATNGPLKKNLSRYKRNRLFRTITDFRPVNDFFESFTPPVHLRQSLSFTTVSL